MSDFEVYMAKIREARECDPKKRTKEQKQMLKLYFFGKSYNELMGEGKI